MVDELPAHWFAVTATRNACIATRLGRNMRMTMAVGRGTCVSSVFSSSCLLWFALVVFHAAACDPAPTCQELQNCRWQGKLRAMVAPQVEMDRVPPVAPDRQAPQDVSMEVAALRRAAAHCRTVTSIRREAPDRWAEWVVAA